jgi:NAD(P)-dependent dehydrogenase (short-subunit alcohol dehydrogenase family)
MGAGPHDLDGQVILVTGGGSGIGRATCTQAARRGARVLALDLDGDAAAGTVGALDGDGHAHVAADVTDPAQVSAAVAAITDEARPTALVVSAGIAQPRTIDQVSPSDLELTFGVNVFGAVYSIQEVLPALRASGGAIVLLSSVAAQVGGGLFGGPHYAASKAALLGLSRSLARELAPSIRVNAVAPGPTDTPIIAELGDEGRRRAAERSLLGRIAQPEEVADAVLWLLGPQSTHVTGQTLNVSGGMVLS